MPTKKQIDEAIAAADEAFWKVIVKHFPKAKTGDVTPLQLNWWEKAEDEIVRHWLENNHP